MKTFECIYRSSKTGREIVILTRAVDAWNAEIDSRKQAKIQFGDEGSHGISPVSIKEVK